MALGPKQGFRKEHRDPRASPHPYELQWRLQCPGRGPCPPYTCLTRAVTRMVSGPAGPSTMWPLRCCC